MADEHDREQHMIARIAKAATVVDEDLPMILF
jgi:hypothetical protein